MQDQRRRAPPPRAWSGTPRRGRAGACSTNPTVSEIVAARPLGSWIRRTVGSSVANSWSATKTSAAGERVHQRGLPGVRVPGDRDLRARRERSRCDRFTSRVRVEVLQVLAQLGDPPPDVLAVHLELGLAGAAAGTDATAHPAHRLAPASEARQQVVQLRELHLRLALAAPRVQREDVEDQRGPVDHLDLELAPPGCAAGPARARRPRSRSRRRSGAARGGSRRACRGRRTSRGSVPGVSARSARRGSAPARVRQRGELVQVRLLDPTTHADQDGLLADARAPGRRERRLEHGVFVDAAAAIRAIRRHQDSERPPRRSMASERRSSGDGEGEPHVALAELAVAGARRDEHAGVIEQPVGERHGRLALGHRDPDVA